MNVLVLLLLSYIYIYIYINIAVFYVEFAKKMVLFFLFTPQFFIQKFISILHLKRTGMNKDEQVKNLKPLFEAEKFAIISLLLHLDA